MTIVISPEIALTKGMEKIKGRLPEEPKDLIKPIDWDNLSFEGELFEDPTSNDIDFEAEEFPTSTPIAKGLEVPSIPRSVNVYDDLVVPTAKALVKVPASVATSIALLPVAGIASAIELLPKVSEKSDRMFEPGSLDSAMEVFNKVMSIPSKLITTPEERKAVEHINLVMKPIEMAGEGWRLIGEQINNGLVQLGLEPTYLEPLLATYGEAAAIFAVPEVITRLKNSTTFRRMNVRERALVTEQVARWYRDGMTQSEMLRHFGPSSTLWEQALAIRNPMAESYGKLKQYAEVKTSEAKVEGIVKNYNEAPPRPKEPIKPEGIDPDYTFTSQKGNYYEKIGDVWYNNKGNEVTNKFVIKAAEARKTAYGVDEVAADTAEIKAIEEKYNKNIEEVTDKEIEDYFVEKEKEIIEPEVSELPEEVESDILDLEPIQNFRQPDPELTKQRLELMPEFRKIDNPDSLLSRIEIETNSWLDGNDKIDMKAIRDLTSTLAEKSKLWADGTERPGAIFEEMNSAELVDFSERVNSLDKWVSGINREGEGVQLYDIGGAVGKGVKTIFDKLTGRDKTKIQEEPSKPFTVKEEARELVFKRRSGLDLANYDTSKFVNSIEQRTTKLQRETMPFIIEGTDVPSELGRSDIEKVHSKDKKYLEDIAKEVKTHFEEGWKKTKKHIPDLTVKQIEDYVTHLWDIPRHKKAEAVSWFSTQNRFLEKRFVETYKEGIEKGFKPRTLDISEIIKIHDAVSNRAIENTKYVKALLNMERGGIKLIERGDKAPLDWVEVDYPALTRRIPIKKTKAKKKGEFVKESKVRVHPDLVRPLKVIFEERFDHPVISAYEAINGVMKAAKLSLSLFHPGALVETATALMGLAKAVEIFRPSKIYKSLVKGDFEVFKKEPIARDSIESGVQYGATADIPINKIQGYLNDLASMTKDVTMLNRLTKFTADFNSVWNKALWSYIHDTFKLYGYESLVGKLDPKLDAEATRKAKREIAQFVNDTFGGQNWDNLMITPKEVQMMAWSLLSADWTVSTTIQALAVTGIGRVYKETAGLRRKMGTNFWLKAALYFGLGMNILNALYREKDMKDNPQYYEDREYSVLEKSMYGNTIGKKTYLFKGRYKDGTERYVRWGKQFRDFFELIFNFGKKLGGKIAPVPQFLSEFFTGHTLSGFRNDDIYGRKGWEKAKGVVKLVGNAFLPISVRRYLREDVEFKPLDIAMQSTKGMSRGASVEFFKEAIVKGDEDMLWDVYVGTLRNNLPAFTLFNSAMSSIESEYMAELSKDTQDIDDAEAKLSVSTSAYDKMKYGKILARLSKEKADKEAGLKLFKSAIAKMKAHLEISKVPGLPKVKDSRRNISNEEFISFE